MDINSVYQLNDDPLIYISLGYKNWDKVENPSGKKGYLLVHTMWYLGLTSIPLYKKFQWRLRKKNIELIILVNSKREQRNAKLYGISNVFINQNLHVNENLFNIDTSVTKVYDAVYIAQAKKFKRLWLAKDIERLYVITYFWPDVRNEQGEWDLHSFEPRISHAEFNKHRINKKQINGILSQSHCGLALSKKEGAMFASMEYLLSGLPIVSTKSIGGRDVFYDDRFVFIVNDDSKSVAQGIEKAKKIDVSPELIRNETLKKVNFHRKKLYDFVCDLLKKDNKKYMLYEDFCEYMWGKDGIENHVVLR